jgi:PAS domain S-box-containing protein
MSDEISSALVLDIAFDAFLAIDSQGLIREWNSKAERLFGWSREEAAGRPAHCIVPERHRADFEEKLLQGGSIITTGVRRNGTEFPAELSAARTPEGLVSFVRDLSPLPSSEAEELRGILNSLEDGYTEVDLRGRYLFVNEAYCRMFHRTREEVCSTSYKQYFDPEPAAQFKKIFGSVYESGKPVKAVEIEYKAGHFIELSVSLKRNAAGQPTGFLTLTRETTERKRHEQELAAA